MPCRLTRAGAALEAEPLPWTGSADLVGLAAADGLLAIPAGRRHESGDEVAVLLFDRSIW